MPAGTQPAVVGVREASGRWARNPAGPPLAPLPRTSVPPVEKQDDPTLSVMAPNVTVEGTTPGPEAGERSKRVPPRPGHHAPQVGAAGFLLSSLSLAVS